MEKIGGAEAVAKLALVVELRAGWDGQFQLFEIVAQQRLGDFGVVADGIATKAGAKIAQGELNVFDIRPQAVRRG